MTNLVTLCDGVKTEVDKRSTTDEIYLELYKAFDTVLHIFVSKLGRHGFGRWTTQWIKNSLDSRTQRVVENG